MLIDSDYLDLVLALVVVFFLSSLVVSGLNEGLQLITRVRSKFLWAYLYELTTHESERTKKTLPRGPGEVFSFWWPGRPSWWRWWWPGAGENIDPRPSVTDPTSGAADRHDTAALLDSLAPLHVPQVSGRDYRPTSIQHIPTSSLAGGLLEVLAGTDRSVLADDAEGLTIHDRIEQAVVARAGTPIGPTLNRLWISAERDIDEFRHGLERWFDGEMSRLGGFYRRTVRWILAVVAVVVATVLNVDTISLAGDLWENPEGRSALVARAEELAVLEPEAATTAGRDSALARLREACESEVASEAVPSGDPVEQAASAVGEVRACLNDAFDDLNQLDVTGNSLLNGWRDWQESWTSDPFRSKTWYRHLIGIVAFWAALVVGSQFWFDVIKRLTGVRTGRVGDT